MSNKNIQNDKYYTPIEVANYCWGKVNEIIGFDNISEIIEPSCGDGAFFHHPKYTPHFGYDIEPEFSSGSSTIIQGDFFDAQINYLPGRLFIGNPPFGNRNTLSVKFYNRCCELGDYIAFILPISQLNNNLQMYKFDLIASFDLGEVVYSGIKLHCCFNIYQRPVSMELNPKPNFKLQDITIIEHRRQTGTDRYVDPNYDYAMCNWGNGSLGKVPSYVGEYAQEVYFYCHNKKYLNDMINLLAYDNIRKYVSSISGKKISVALLYKYLKDNIDGIK